MTMDLAECNAGIAYYWCEIGRRSSDVQAREHAFPDLARRYAARQPPHFTRQDLHFIIEWKYTDGRWRKRALTGLDAVSGRRLQSVTCAIARLDEPAAAARALRGLIKGVGIAGVSAILAAAKPEQFPVIDVFAILAICHHESPSWIMALSRSAEGRFQPDEASYSPYTRYCREKAGELSQAAGESWSPATTTVEFNAFGSQS